ncbi:MAG: guanylate kinase, partial [Thermoanaerobaculia bacterium]
MSRGDLFIVSSPSGAGKTTLIRRVLEDPRIGGTLHFSVSHTTRPPRTGERDGVEYHFVDEAEFRAIEVRGGFLEWAVVHGNLYGTSRAEVEPRLERGLDVLLDIDVQGARQVRSHVPEAVKVIVFPPSREVLEARLKARASDAPEA